MTTYLRYLFYICVMITLYEIICPISNKVVYVGITKDIGLRYNQHKWGCKKDSNIKRQWTEKIKSEKLKPILNIVTSYDTFTEAKINERKHIVKLINEGLDIFNVTDNLFYYQYDLHGKLINVYSTLREIKKETGISVNLNRYTSGGFVWTNGIYDNFKLLKYKESKSVNCKRVQQLDKSENIINEFHGVREACRITKIDHRSIAQVAGGSKIRKTAGGYKWRYI